MCACVRVCDLNVSVLIKSVLTIKTGHDDIHMNLRKSLVS